MDVYTARWNTKRVCKYSGKKTYFLSPDKTSVIIHCFHCVYIQYIRVCSSSIHLYHYSVQWHCHSGQVFEKHFWKSSASALSWGLCTTFMLHNSTEENAAAEVTRNGTDWTLLSFWKIKFLLYHKLKICHFKTNFTSNFTLKLMKNLWKAIHASYLFSTCNIYL